MNTILLILAVIACPLLWTMMIVPLIARLFGIPVKIGSLPIHRQDQRLGKTQSFWFGGLLGWGVGLSLLGGFLQRFIDQTRSTLPSLLLAIAASLMIGGVASMLDWTYPLNRE